MLKPTKIVALAASIPLLLASLAVAASSRQGADDSDAYRAASKCPKLSVPPLYGDLDEVITAARKLLIRGSVTVQGQTTRLTRKNSPIRAVVKLARSAVPFPGAATLRGAAARRCGSDTAQASWAVMIGVPNLMADTSSRLAFLVKTKAGWRTY